MAQNVSALDGMFFVFLFLFYWVHSFSSDSLTKLKNKNNKQNGFLNGVYPGHPTRGLLMIGIITGLKKSKNIDTSFGLITIIQEKIPRNWLSPSKSEIVACTVFASGLWLTAVGVRVGSLKLLLSYHGWMYEARGKISMKTKLWAVCVFFPSKYSVVVLCNCCRRSSTKRHFVEWIDWPGIDQDNDGLSSKALQLPERFAYSARSQAVQNNHTRKLFKCDRSEQQCSIKTYTINNHTCLLYWKTQQYLRTIRPLYSDEEFARIEKQAIEFQNGIGPRLQRYLTFKSLISSNYVSDWWEEYVYLRGRSPIMVNSNFYALDSITRTSSAIQAARAANIVAAIFMYRRALDNESLEPIMAQDQIPLCSRQHERQFNTTRLPGEQTDKLVHYRDSKHIAVYSKGKWFKMYTYYQSQPLNARELESQIQKILDEKSEAFSGEKHLAALTAGERLPWAQARKKFFAKGVNKSSLSAIEKAAFVLVLDEDEYPYTTVTIHLDLTILLSIDFAF